MLTVAGQTLQRSWHHITCVPSCTMHLAVELSYCVCVHSMAAHKQESTPMCHQQPASCLIIRPKLLMSSLTASAEQHANYTGVVHAFIMITFQVCASPVTATHRLDGQECCVSLCNSVAAGIAGVACSIGKMVHLLKTLAGHLFVRHLMYATQYTVLVLPASWHASFAGAACTVVTPVMSDCYKP